MPILSIAVPELESHLYYNVIKQCVHKVCYDLGLENIINAIDKGIIKIKVQFNPLASSCLNPFVLSFTEYEESVGYITATNDSTMMFSAA